MLSKLKDFSDANLEPLGRWLGRKGVKPNYLTGLGLFVTLAAAWQLYHCEIIFAVTLILLAGLLDSLDGMVARTNDSATRWGGYLDAVSDRYGDTLVFGALLLGGWLAPLTLDGHAPGWLAGITPAAWAIGALSGAILTSYARAAAERLGVDQMGIGVLERPERLGLLSLGLLVGALLGSEAAWATGMLALLTLLGHFTVGQRIWHFRKQTYRRA